MAGFVETLKNDEEHRLVISKSVRTIAAIPDGYSITVSHDANNQVISITADRAHLGKLRDADGAIRHFPTLPDAIAACIADNEEGTP